jgi:hypothetical protein
MSALRQSGPRVDASCATELCVALESITDSYRQIKARGIAVQANAVHHVAICVQHRRALIRQPAGIETGDATHDQAGGAPRPTAAGAGFRVGGATGQGLVEGGHAEEG